MDAREAALEALTACRKAEAWADGALQSVIRRNGLEPRDAALAARLTYGVVQNRDLLDFYVSAFCKQKADQLEPVIRDILRIGVYQLLFLDKIPPSAAVNRAVEMTRDHRRPKAAGMVNAVLRNLQRSRERLPEPPSLAVRYSHPQWLCDRLKALLGREETEALLDCHNRPAPAAAQVNRIRYTVLEARERLRLEGVSAEEHPWLSNCLLLGETGSLEALESFRGGMFYIQDPAARLAVTAAGAEPGMNVLDLCAAPGGKSFAAALDMGDRGRILARDIHPNKLRLIEEGARRLGLTCIETAPGDAQDTAGLEEKFDLVLCDVPCSGLGVIRKKPDIRWKRPEDLAGLPAVQLAILRAAARCVKPGGALIYATCTILPEENQGVTEAFLEERSDFRREGFVLPGPAGRCPEGQVTFWPHRAGTDGFYICRLRRDFALQD